MKNEIIKTLITLAVAFTILSPLFIIEPINKIGCDNEYSLFAHVYVIFLGVLFGWLLGSSIRKFIDTLF